MNGMLCQVKEGVLLNGLSGEMWNAVDEISAAFEAEGYPCIITSGRDGTHKPGSKHYSGNALDFRALHVGDMTTRNIILARIKERLGVNFDCLLHGKILHYHIEYDPK